MRSANLPKGGIRRIRTARDQVNLRKPSRNVNRFYSSAIMRYYGFLRAQGRTSLPGPGEGSSGAEFHFQRRAHVSELRECVAKGVLCATPPNRLGFSRGRTRGQAVKASGDESYPLSELRSLRYGVSRHSRGGGRHRICQAFLLGCPAEALLMRKAYENDEVELSAQSEGKCLTGYA